MNRRAALLFVGLAAGAPPAAAQDVTGRVADVGFEIDAPWPARLGKGYFPVFVRLENASGEPRTVTLSTDRWGGWLPLQQLRREVRIAPGKRLELELLAPAFHPEGHEGNVVTNVMVESEDAASGGNLPPGAKSWYDGTFSALVFRPPGASDIDGGDVETGLSAVSGGSEPAYVSGRATHQFSVAVEGFRFLPQRWQAYSSLDAVGLDVAGGAPREEQLAPLLAWVRLGGRLVVMGEGAEARLAEFRSLSDLFEPRFAMTAGRVTTYAVGLGRVTFPDEPLSVTPGSGALRSLLDELQRATEAGARDSWVPMPEQWRFADARLRIPGVDELPLRVFMMLLFAFAVLIGPVNLIFIKRMRRPGLLLLTIPGVSLVASLGILGYGIFSQGIDVKLASRSLTVLDQRRDQASTVEQRAMFAGLTPGHGLRPGPGSTVFPDGMLIGDGQRFLIEVDERGTELRASYLPVRTEVAQVVMSSAAAQGRLELRASGASIQVTNQLIGADVQALVLRDADGVWYHLAELPEGETATLEPLADWSEERGLPSDVAPSATRGPYAELRLVPGTYAARVDVNPFRDDLGLSTTDKQSWHVVYGIFEEDWR
jgi:hypothetical protein